MVASTALLSWYPLIWGSHLLIGTRRFDLWVDNIQTLKCIHRTSIKYHLGNNTRAIINLAVFLVIVEIFMMTSSKGNIFRVTGPSRREFTGHRWIPCTKASVAELWWFLWSAPWINSWVNNCEACYLRRYRAHYDVILMFWLVQFILSSEAPDRALPFRTKTWRRLDMERLPALRVIN